MNPFTRIRLPVAVLTALCGVAVAVGGLLPWLSARDARPSLGMTHTSFSQMLVYTFDGDSSILASVGFVVVVLGLLMVVGALLGIRTLTIVASIVALGAGGMWIGLAVHYHNTPNLPNIHYLNPANLPWSDLRIGAWLTIVGAVLGLLSAFVLLRPNSDPAA